MLPSTTISKFCSHFSQAISLHFRLLCMLFKLRNASSIDISSWKSRLLSAGQIIGHPAYSPDYLAISLLFFHLNISLPFWLLTHPLIYLSIYPRIIFSFMSACGPNTRDGFISEWSHLDLLPGNDTGCFVTRTVSWPCLKLIKLLLVQAVKLSDSK